MTDKMREENIEEFIEVMSDYRKASYEFAKTNDLDDHERIMSAQRKLANMYEAATEKSTAKIAELQGRIDELVDLLSQSELMLKSLYDAINQMQVKEV